MKISLRESEENWRLGLGPIRSSNNVRKPLVFSEPKRKTSFKGYLRKSEVFSNKMKYPQVISSETTFDDNELPYYKELMKATSLITNIAGIGFNSIRDKGKWSGTASRACSALSYMCKLVTHDATPSILGYKYTYFLRCSAKRNLRKLKFLRNYSSLQSQWDWTSTLSPKGIGLSPRLLKSGVVKK